MKGRRRQQVHLHRQGKPHGGQTSTSCANGKTETGSAAGNSAAMEAAKPRGSSVTGGASRSGASGRHAPPGQRGYQVALTPRVHWDARISVRRLPRLLPRRRQKLPSLPGG